MKKQMLAICISMLMVIGPSNGYSSEAANQDFSEKLREDGNRSDPTGERSSSGSLMGLSGVASSDKGDDEANKGLDDVFSDIKTHLQGLMDARIQIERKMPGVVFQAPGYEVLAKSGSQYVEYRDTCISRQGKAASVCLEHLSEDLQTGVATINTLLSTVGSMAVKDTCSKFSKAMDVAKAAMTAYTSACGVMKAGCGWSCVKSRSGLDGMKKGLEAASKGVSCQVTIPQNLPQYTEHQAACSEFVSKYSSHLKGLMASVPRELAEKDKKAVAGKAAVCTGKYAILLASAGTGILSLANSIKQGNECEDESDGTGTQVAETAVDKCADAAKAANDPECICKLNPRTVGCANSFQKANEGSQGRLATGGSDTSAQTGNRNVAGGLGGLGGGKDEFGSGLPGGSGSDSGGLPGAPTGGGSGLSGFGGGSGGGAAGEGEAAKKGLNTDILAGSGGGGGGGSFGAYRGAADSKYRAYLPGGAKDPAQNMAGQQPWNKEVTGQGGKSNWDKVKERYRDNKNTLLNN